MNSLIDSYVRHYTNSGNNYVQIYWVITDTLSFFVQFSSAGNAGFYKVENGTTTAVKSW